MNTLPGKVQSAEAGKRGFDLNQVLTPYDIQQFINEGYEFCLRYVARGKESDSPINLKTEEAQAILSAGLALMPVQHAHPSGWTPSGTLGRSDGANASTFVNATGFPPGMNVWCDLEGVAEGTPQQPIIDYCTEWFQAVANADFVPGLYVGSPHRLLPPHFMQLPFEHYWRAYNEGLPNVAGRGYQLLQTPKPADSRIKKISFDADITQKDAKGGQVLWLAPTK